MRKSRASLYTREQTNEQIGLDEGNCWGLVQPAPFADGKDGAPAQVQRSTQDNDPHRLHEQPDECLWKDSSQNAVKHLHQIAAYELIFLALCCTCSLQMYQFPVGDGWLKQTYDNRTHSVLNPLRFLTIPIRCTVRQVNVGEFGPGEALHVDVHLITVHTLVSF